MLKQLIQLFAEKFLIKKKSWLFSNSINIDLNKIQTIREYSTPSVGEITYTAPDNGCYFVSFKNIPGSSGGILSCSASLYGVSNSKSFFELHTTSGYALQESLYVSKGQTIRFWVNNQEQGGIEGLFFVPQA